MLNIFFAYLHGLSRCRLEMFLRLFRNCYALANKLTLPAAVTPRKEPVTDVFYMFCLICLIVISLESKRVAILSANY